MSVEVLSVKEDNSFWGPGELEEVSACPGCGGSNFAAYYKGLEDLLEHIPGTWSIFECNGCGSFLLNPRPSRISVAKAYVPGYCTHAPAEESHRKDNGASTWWRLANGYLNNRFGCERRPSSSIGRWLVPVLWPLRQQLDYYYRHLPRKPGRLLDVGCGNGTFMLRAKEAGWDVEGIEPDLTAAQQATSAGLCIHAMLPQSFEPAKQYDRVTLSHVIEHVHDPLELFEKCFQMLIPNGEIWLSLPNIAGFGHRLYGRNWFALDPPRHLFLPKVKILKEMLLIAGFSDLRVRRRGRGAGTTLRESDRYAELRGSKQRWVAGWRGIIDIVASLFSTRAEELVISARKSGN